MPENTNPVTDHTRNSTSIPGYVVTLDGEENFEQLNRKAKSAVRHIGKELKKQALALQDFSIYEEGVFRERLENQTFDNLIFPTNADDDYKKEVRAAIRRAISNQTEQILHPNPIVIERGFDQISGHGETTVKGKHIAADPVTLFNGQFTHMTSDMSINGAGMDFIFSRTYKNQAFFNGPIGHNWDHNYNLWIRVSEDEQIIVRSTGSLREDIFRKHPLFDYWVPPDGEDGIFLQEGGIFVFRMQNGTRISYGSNSSDLNIIHLADQITDRFGNFLRFFYQDNLLRLVEINHPKRIIQFSYNATGQISGISDFTGRTWRYKYDDFDDLIAVITPGTDHYPQGLTTCYGYSSSRYTGELQHNLETILDAKGQIYLRNEYGSQSGNLGFNRVVRQRQGGGETLFEYEDVIEEFEFEYSESERPAHQTTMVDRNGQTSRHIYNHFGNLLFKEECVILRGVPQLLRHHYRYNRDGNLTGTLSPEGVMTQYLYGRDLYVRLHQINEEEELSVHDQLTPTQRQSFHRVLSIVRRKKYFTLSDLNLSQDVWGDIFPDIIGAVDLDEEGNSEDIIVKMTYEPEYGQILTQSDPRFTNSADPNTIHEHPRHFETQTRYEYMGPPGDQNRLLSQIRRPGPTLPDGTEGKEVVEKYEEYDFKGRLHRHRNSLDITTEFIYFLEDTSDVKSGHLKKIIADPGGLEIITEYNLDELGRIITTNTPNSVESHDEHLITTSRYNELDQIVEVISSKPFEIKTLYHYDKNGNLERFEQDAKNEEGKDLPDSPVVNTFEYDEEFNPVAISIGGTEPSLRHITKHSYDSAGNLALTIQPKGNRLQYFYDERQLPVKQTTGAGTGESSSVRTEYDGDGRIIRQFDALGNPIKFTLDAFGRIASEEDALGNTSQYIYNKANEVIVERFFERKENGEYFLLLRRETSYDELNRPIITGENLFDNPLGPLSKTELKDAFAISPGPGKLLLTKRFYDEGGRIAKVIDPKNNEMIYHYDNLNRLIKEIDPMGHSMEYQYDRHSNLIRSDQVDLVLDPDLGTPVDKRVFSNEYRYDELDRMVSATDSLGNTTHYSYDSRSNLVQTTDPLGNVVRSEFDIFGRMQATIREQTDTGLGEGQLLQPSKTFFTYDENGNITEVKDALGRSTTYEYDALDRRIATVYPNGTRSTFEFDAQGNLKRKKDNNGIQRLFQMDQLNRIIRVDVDSSELVHGVTLEGSRFEVYSYDGFDRILLEENDFAKCQTEYNSMSWILTEEISFTTLNAPTDQKYRVERMYDKTGTITDLVYPNGRRLKFFRDELERLVKIENRSMGIDHPGNPSLAAIHDIVSMQYKGQQRNLSVFGNGSFVEYKHDGEARIIEISHRSPSSSFLTLQYLYDAVGNMRLRNRIIPLQMTGESFGYDSFYQLVDIQGKDDSPFDPELFAPLTEVISGIIPHRQIDINNVIGPLHLQGGKKTYDHDLVGNRKSELLPNGTDIEYEINELDQYVQAGETTMSFDLNGNVTSDGIHSYIYDSFNRLVKVFDLEKNEPVAEFYHDTQGRRILEILNGQSKHLVWVGSALLEEYKNNVPFAQYVYDDGIDRLVQISAGGTEHWYHTDLVNSVQLLTDQNGRQAEIYNYNPFGKLTSESQGIYNPFRYNSRRFDEAIDLYDYRLRTYSPSLGRFLQRDPEGMVDGTNLYLYTGNNPLTFTDPSGTGREEFCKEPFHGFKQERFTLLNLSDNQLSQLVLEGQLRQEQRNREWRQAITEELSHQNELILTPDGPRRRGAYNKWVYGQYVTNVQSNITSNIVGAYGYQLAENWTDDPDIIQGVSGMGAALGNFISKPKGPASRSQIAGRLPGRSWIRRIRRWRGRNVVRRALQSRDNLTGNVVAREISVATGKEVFRHDIYHHLPPIIYARIENEGLRISQPGISGQYGPGAYAWPSGHSSPGAYIDIRVKAGTAIETLTVKSTTFGGIGKWVRLVPKKGDYVKVSIVGTNLSAKEIELGRKFFKSGK